MAGADRLRKNGPRRPDQVFSRCARPVTMLLASAVVVVGSGCASNRHGQLVAFLRANEQAVATGHYTVMPPDVITIHAPVSPEIDGTSARLRPDGKIAVRLLGEVDVAGLTTEQMAEKLRRQLARYYMDPEVVVSVSAYASQFYYIFGEVSTPGPHAFTGRDTVLSALANARPSFLAWRSQIRLVRPAQDKDSEKSTLMIDLDRMVRTGAMDQNLLLQPGDILEVPPTPLAWVGLRVRELLFPVTPLVEAYNQPTEPIRSTHVYEDEFGSQDEPDRARRFYR